jgi:hypothetical protein
MKSSCTLYLLLALQLGGSAEAFARAGKHSNVGAQYTSRKTPPIIKPKDFRRTSSTSSTRLYADRIINAKRELLNNRHSAKDWFYNIRSLPQSVVLREIRNPVLSVFGWACFISVLYKFLLQSKRKALQTLATQISIPGTAHSYLVSALGLLLVFRTNSAYQRFNVRL